MNMSNVIPRSTVLRQRRPLRSVPSFHVKSPVTAPVSTSSAQTNIAEDDVAIFWAMYEMHYDLLFLDSDPSYAGASGLEAAV